MSVGRCHAPDVLLSAVLARRMSCTALSWHAGWCGPPCAVAPDVLAHGCAVVVSGLRFQVAHSAARNNSLIEVLARVWASTRLTMTAQYRPYLPFDEGNVPGTTTDPAGTRPWMIVSVVRS